MTTQLSLTQKIGQLIVVRTTGYLFDHQIRYSAWEATQSQLKQWLQEFNLGGVILLGGSCAEIAYRTQQLQSWAKTPLLICADIEEGVGQRFSGATWFPPPMALSAIASKNSTLAQDYAQKMGQITAQEAVAIGLNWILAPVTDVNNNPLNPVINVRAFSDRTSVVGDLATAFIRGCQELPILTTAKHFPGHGDTATDSHLDLPRLTHSRSRLEEIELPPFQQAINQGVDTVMTAHLLVEAFDRKNPATLSQAILTTQLREKMGFEGLIVTDALIMGGVAKYAPSGEIAVRALQGGADILLMPENPEIAIKSIELAVENGLLTEARIDRSLARIAQAKQKIFASPTSFSPLAIEAISTPKAQMTVEEILKQSTIKQGKLPLLNSAGGINLIVIDDFLSCDFLDRQTPGVAIPEAFGYQTQIVESKNTHFSNPEDKNLLLQVFIRGNPFRGSAGLTEQTKLFYQQLLSNNILDGVVIYGSPYVLDWFQEHLPSTTPWIFTYGQMPSAQTIAQNLLFSASSAKQQPGSFL